MELIFNLDETFARVADYTPLQYSQQRVNIKKEEKANVVIFIRHVVTNGTKLMKYFVFPHVRYSAIFYVLAFNKKNLTSKSINVSKYVH